MPELIKLRSIVKDDWKIVGNAASETNTSNELPSGNHLILPLSFWQARLPELQQRIKQLKEEHGVWLAPEQPVEALVDFLSELSLIALDFPKLADGRHYSSARLLRQRYGYQGELRAFGDIGQDQLYFLSRVGFDSFVIKEEGADAQAAQAAFKSFPEDYQAAANQPLPLFRRRFA